MRSGVILKPRVSLWVNEPSDQGGHTHVFTHFPPR